MRHHLILFSLMIPLIIGCADDGPPKSSPAPAETIWKPTSLSDAPEVRSSHKAIWTGTEMVVWGQVDRTGGRYQPATDTWIATTTEAAPDYRTVGHEAIWTGTEMIIWGGSAIPGPGPLDMEGARYSPATDSWTTMRKSGFRHPSGIAVWTGAEMFVWNTENKSASYKPISDSWTQRSEFRPVFNSRSYHGVYGVWADHQVLFLLSGGWTIEPASGQVTGATAPLVIATYSLTNDSWLLQGTSAGPAGRAESTSVWTGKELIVWGGSRLLQSFTENEGTLLVETYEVLGDGGRYNPKTDQWSLLPVTSKSPEPRAGHRAVWTGKEILIWGGAKGTYSPRNDTLGSGARYNPESDLWQPMSMEGAALPRLAFTMIWTGVEAIVWGGYFTRINECFPEKTESRFGDVCETNTGGRYRPDLEP